MSEDLIQLVYRDEDLARMEMLISQGANVNIRTTRSWNNPTVLIIAAARGYQKTVDLLLKSGASVNLADNQGFTPLMTAISEMNNECVELIVQAGADINMTDRKGNTSLTISVLWANTRITKLLLQKEISINVGPIKILNPDKNNSNTDEVISILFAAGQEIPEEYVNQIPVVYGECQTLKQICREKVRKQLLRLNRNTSIFTQTASFKLPLPDILLKYLVYDIELS